MSVCVPGSETKSAPFNEYFPSVTASGTPASFTVPLPIATRSTPVPYTSTTMFFPATARNLKSWPFQTWAVSLLVESPRHSAPVTSGASPLTPVSMTILPWSTWPITEPVIVS